MKTYSGIFKPKNPDKYKGNVNNIIYRSSWERSVFKWLDENKDIKKWSSEEVIIPYFYEIDKSYHRYFPDVYYETTENKKFLIEIKPHKETQKPKGKRRTKQYIEEGYTYIKNQNKWEAAEHYCKKKGWKFSIWTEKHLQKMGLIPKPFKKLKKLPAYKKPTKKR